MLCAVWRILNNLKVAFCLMHVTPSHFHYYADLPTSIIHIRLIILEACINALWVFCRECVYDVVRSLGYLAYFRRKMWGCMCWTGPFKFMWSRRHNYNSSYHNEIGSINLPYCYNIYPCLCVWSGCTIIYVYIYIIYIYTSRESWGFRLWLLCSLMMCRNNRVHCGLMVVYGHLHITLLHYHHYAELPDGIELLKCSSDMFCL